MLKKAILFTLFSVLFLSVTQAQTARSIVNDMIKSIDNTRTSSYTFLKKERFKGKVKEGKMLVKVDDSATKKVYIKSHYPNKGVEILWVKGERSGKAIVNPNGFPYINLNLSPYGSQMRKDNHHVVSTSGFKYLGAIMRNGLKLAGDQFDDYYSYNGNITWQGRDCYKLELMVQEFGYSDYTLTKSESLNQLAARLLLSAHMIKEKNGLGSYSKLAAGTTIQIPNAYAKKTLLYVDKENKLPIYQEIYDDKGLYEQYEFYDLKVNPAFPSDEFTKDCSNYGF